MLNILKEALLECCIFFFFFFLLLHKIYSIHESNNIHTISIQRIKDIIIMVSFNYVYTSIITISVTCINEEYIPMINL